MKRIIIIAIYLAIFCGIAFFVFWQLRPKPDCFDKIQNQNEEGIDCGGVCEAQCQLSKQQDLQILSSGFVDSGLPGKIDLYAQVNNPNQAVGAVSFDYEFTVKKTDGSVAGSRQGTSFILPGDTKYVVESNIDVPSEQISADFKIGNVEWVEANDAYENPNVKVVNKNYRQISGGVGYAEATGLVKNESPLDFNNIKIKVLLEDDAGKILAINATQMNTVKSGENREFKVYWPSRFPGEVRDMLVQIEINLFDSDAFFTRYFKPQRFQQY